MRLKWFLGLAILLGSLFLLPGMAGAQTALSTTDFTGGAYGTSTTNTTPGNTTDWGNSWIDLAGGVGKAGSLDYGKITSTNYPYTVTYAVPINQMMMRPSSETSSILDEELYCTFLSNTSSAPFCILRYQKPGCAYAGEYYSSSTTAGTLYLFSIIGGVLTSVGTAQSITTGITAGDKLGLAVSVVGSNPTTITGVVSDVTKTTTLKSYTQTDSTGLLQSAGQVGLAAYGAATILQAISYSVPAMSCSTSAVVTSSSGNILTITGRNTNWVNGTTSFSATNGTVTNTTINSATSATVTLTAGSTTGAGATVLSENTDSATCSLSVYAAATSYTATASSAAWQNGNAITITYAANGTSGVVVTPSLSAGSGTFSPTTVTLNGESAVTQTFTPSATGTTTITFANSGSLANASNLTASVTNFVPSSNAAWFWSPAAWVSNNGRSTGNFEQTNEQGSYARLYFTSSTTSPTCSVIFDCSTYSSIAAPPEISYQVDGLWTDNITLSSSGTDVVSLTMPSTSGAHVVTIWCRNASQFGGWSGITPNYNNVYRIVGAAIDTNSTAGTAPAFSGNNNWVMFIGPSLAVGTYANNAYDDSLVAYPHFEGEAFRNIQGYEYCTKAFGDLGFGAQGEADSLVPALYPITGSSGGTGGTLGPCSWNMIDPNNSLLDSSNYISAYGSTSQQPYAIQVNLGDNDCRVAMSASNLEASVTQFLVALRAAAPNAWIFIGPGEEMGIAAGGSFASDPAYAGYVDTGVNNYLTANPADTKTKLIDFTASLSGTVLEVPYLGGGYVHPNSSGHALIADTIMSYITKTVNASSGAVGRGRTLK